MSPREPDPGHRRERSRIYHVAERYRVVPNVESRRAFRSDHDERSYRRQFAIGDRRYDLGPISLQASFAPFLVGDEAYLPLREVLRALDLALHEENGVAVLQPQLAALDVRQRPLESVVAGGASARASRAREPGSYYLRLRRRRHVAERYAPSRHRRHRQHYDRQFWNRSRTDNPGDRELQSGAVAEAPQNTDGRDVLLAFDGPGATNPEQRRHKKHRRRRSLRPTRRPRAVRRVCAKRSRDRNGRHRPAVGGRGFGCDCDHRQRNVRMDRLREPDNRFWVDIANARFRGRRSIKRRPRRCFRCASAR